MGLEQLSERYAEHNRVERGAGFVFAGPERIELFRRYVGGPGRRVLDLGCRDGSLSRAYATGNESVGVDADRAALAGAAPPRHRRPLGRTSAAALRKRHRLLRAQAALKLAQVGRRPFQSEEGEPGAERGRTAPVEKIGVVEVRVDNLPAIGSEHAPRE